MMNSTGPSPGQPVRYLAHSRNDEGAGVAEALRDHLLAVADRAARVAAPFNADEQAYGAGLVHDLGKYADQFLRRLQDPREPSRDHWSVGAAFLAATAGRWGLTPAIAVAGHHSGLARLPENVKDFGRELLRAFKSLPDRFTEVDLRLLVERFTADGFAVPRVGRGLAVTGQFAGDMLDVRMLFSALVDADFLETEAHFNGDLQTPRRPRPDGPTLDGDRGMAPDPTLVGLDSVLLRRCVHKFMYRFFHPLAALHHYGDSQCPTVPSFSSTTPV